MAARERRTRFTGGGGNIIDFLAPVGEATAKAMGFVRDAFQQANGPSLPNPYAGCDHPH
jgi:hypothetical protein